MRVLWLCNICPPAVARALGQAYSVREGWITGLLDRYLAACGGQAGGAAGAGCVSMELGICYPQSGGQPQRPRRLWLTPSGQECKEGVGKEIAVYAFQEDLTHPENEDASLEPAMKEILKAFSPDLVHIFGTEFPHALAMARAFGRPERTLVGLQGMMGECADAYLADLPEKVTGKVTLRDWLRRDSMRQQQEKFKKRGEREARLLRMVGHVTGRTAFDREVSLKLNPALKYHTMNETMRPCFYEGRWDRSHCREGVIFLSQADYPLKGMHYMLSAMPAILDKVPNARIRVAGNVITAHGTLKERLKLSGYGKYLLSLMRELDLMERVETIGPLDAEQMKEEYLSCQMFVCPSSLENSPNSLAEAMLLGVPCVATAAGGIPDLAEDGESALLFPRGDSDRLAERVVEVFQNDLLSRQLSERAAQEAGARYDGAANYARLLHIYEKILQEDGRS